MELKDFVKNVIVEISTGMLEAKNELKDLDVLINPSSNSGVIKESQNSERLIQYIEFDVSVEVKSEESASKEGEKEVGGKLQVASFLNIGASKKNTNTENSVTENISNNRVKFSIPVSFPTNTTLDKENKNTRVKGSTAF